MFKALFLTGLFFDCIILVNYTEISMLNKGYVPPDVHKILMDYFDHCWQPGGFLTAVLQNDLLTASFRADHNNRPHLAEIAAWVYHNAPIGSWGSCEAVNGWLNKNEYQQRYEKQRIMEILSTE